MQHRILTATHIKNRFVHNSNILQDLLKTVHGFALVEHIGDQTLSYQIREVKDNRIENGGRWGLLEWKNKH